MPAFVLVSPKPLSGKTTIAAGLAHRLRKEGKTIALTRTGDDANAGSDGALFATLSSPAAPGAVHVTLTEVSSGDTATDARAIVVADASVPPAEIASFGSALGGSLAGLILNRVPQSRTQVIRSDAEAQGMRVLGTVAEDRLLAAPTLGEVAAALQADRMFFDSNGGRPLDHTLIASISADPGQGYFVRTGANTVIVRSDKPDLQLAALNAGAGAMIVTGDKPILGYVLSRAEEDTIPLLRTKLETVAAVKVIEDLYAAKGFTGGADKLKRAAELTGEIDLAELVS